MKNQLPENLKGKELKDSYKSLSRLLINRPAKEKKVTGINGPPGCGKTTLCRKIKHHLRKNDINTVTLSIDDFYWTYNRRKSEANDKKLLDVRGPGTHDIPLALKTLNNLLKAKEGSETPLPRFNKWLKNGRGDRAPANEWEIFKGSPDIIILEGWNICQEPIPDSELKRPFNILEKSDSPNGRTRKYINKRLKEDYPKLWKYIGFLIMIKIDGIKTVYKQREEQEKELRKKGKSAMKEKEIVDFINHYERWIINIQKTLGEKSDVVIEIDEDRKIRRVK